MITAEFTSEIVNLRVTNLFQWDVNQVIRIGGLNVSGSIEVHFCNKKSETALVVATPNPTNGYVYVNIPNALLTEPYDIVAYVYQREGTSKNTTKTITIPVIARKKPNDYKETTGGTIIVPDSGTSIDLSGATATSADIVSGKTAFIASGMVVGTHTCPTGGGGSNITTSFDASTGTLTITEV